MSEVDIAIVLAASLAGAFIKSITGMGYPVVAVPLIALALGVEDAVVIVAAPNLAANIALCYRARDGRHGARDLPRFLVFGAIGAAVGTVALVMVPERILLAVLAVTVFAFIANALRNPEARIAAPTAHRWTPAVGLLAGAMQGAVGVSGPVVGGWFHLYRLARESFVFSITAVFGFTGAVQLGILAATGHYTLERAGVSALAFIPVLAVIPVGARLRDRLGGAMFERAVLGVIALSGLALIVDLLGG